MIRRRPLPLLPPLRKSRRPQESDMTLCIAAHCISQRVNERNVVVCSDRRIETDATSSQVGFKFRKLSHQWAALMAGNIGRAEELMQLYSSHFRDRKEIPETDIAAELRIPPAQFKKKLINEYVQSVIGLTFDEFLQNNQSLPDALFENLSNDIARISIGCQLILIGVPSHQRTQFLYTVDTDGTLYLHTDFAAIGTGASNATAWLHYREQNRFDDVNTTMCRLLEAKRFSENAPGVGEKTIMLWLSNDGQSAISGQDDVFKSKVWKKYGPRDQSGAVNLPDIKATFNKTKWSEVSVG